MIHVGNHTCRSVQLRASLRASISSTSLKTDCVVMGAAMVCWAAGGEHNTGTHHFSINPNAEHGELQCEHLKTGNTMNMDIITYCLCSCMIQNTTVFKIEYYLDIGELIFTVFNT